MSKPMSPEREREYNELHAYIDFYSTHVREIDPNSQAHPTNVCKRIVKEHGRSIALEGLRQAVNDTVEDLMHQPIEYIQRLDAALHQHGLVTFSEIRRRYSSSYKKILKRGNIKNETEYYIIAGILADLESSVGEEERVLIEQLAMQYEKKPNKV
ncbi:hypothetical protein ACSV5M_10610 [Cellvibrio sp. ARAG 10.3]|uniref:hypothetical protein n=1 Tax=Cellvibrio sp. ARAG 10.3 TaxID=3451358 RepID=UPI003F446B8D